MNLANMVVPDEASEAELAKLATTIAELSPHSHRANKRLLLETDGMTVEAGLAHEVFYGAGRGDDMQARIAAFQNRAR